MEFVFILDDDYLGPFHTGYVVVIVVVTVHEGLLVLDALAQLTLLFRLTLLELLFQSLLLFSLRQFCTLFLLVLLFYFLLDHLLLVQRHLLHTLLERVNRRFGLTLLVL